MTRRPDPPDDVECVALHSGINPGRGYLVGTGENFWSMPERAAELVALGAAELRYPDDPAAVAAVAAYADDPEKRRWIDRRALRAIAEAWAEGMRL